MRQDRPVQPLPDPIPIPATDQILGVPLGLIDYERTLEWIDAMAAERASRATSAYATSIP